MQSVDLESLPSANLLRRMAAGIYDLFLLFAVAFLYTLIATLIMQHLGLEPRGLSVEAPPGSSSVLIADEDFRPMLNGPIYQMGLYLSLALFYISFWRTRSATLGMQTWRLRLTDLDGNRPSWAQLTLRALAGTVSLTVFGLGFLYSLLDKHNRTLHDIVSSTQVVVTPKIKT